MRLGIYPSIGIARVGNALNAFFIGAELSRAPLLELDAAGGTRPMTQFKVDEDEVKRQAARFRIMAVDDDGTSAEFQLPAGATVEWTVRLANTKAAVNRQSSPPAQPTKPQLVANPAGLSIDPGPRTISGANAAPARFDTGEFQGRRVPLGEIRSDAAQRLLVLGGFGFSSSPTNKPLPSFYTNPGWHDDLSDGPITATVRLANGQTITDIAPAWVIISTPDFAPDIQGIVTLYDVIRQVGIDHHGASGPAQVSFSHDIFPILERTRKLQWVHLDPNWTQIPDDWNALADPGAAGQPLRDALAQVVLESQNILNRVNLTSLQKDFLDKWVSGTFLNDWTGIPGAAPLSADNLTRAALDSAVGQGFFPGIEAGILVRKPGIYSTPFAFRIDPAQLAPGDLTALMAVPWQADFEDCEGSWWPSQRPDDVLQTANVQTRVDWSRGVNGRLSMVNNFAKLAYITAQKDSAGNVVFAEAQRAAPESFT